MKIRVLPAALVAIGAAAALGISMITPAPIARQTQVTPPQESRVACQPLGDGQLIAAGRGKITAAPFGGEPGNAVEMLTQPAKGLTTLRGVLPTGGVLHPDGVWASCQAPATSGQVVWPDASKAELRLTNPDARDAAVDLVLTGPDGDIQALGSRDITLSPGETRQVAVSVLTEGVQGPVSATWTTSRGRAVAVGVTAGTPQFAEASTMPDTRHILPGQGKDGKPVVVLANPGESRASASIVFHSPTSTFTPAGGEDVTVAPHSVVAVPLDAGTNGDPGAFTVESDQPITTVLFSGSGDVKGTSGAQAADTSLGGVVPAGAALQVTNPGEQVAEATVEIDGASQQIKVQPGTTSSVPVPQGAQPARVRVKSSQPVVGAAVTDKGAAVVPLRADTVEDAKPIDVQPAPNLH